MKNEQKQDKQSRGRRSLKVQDLEATGVEVKGGNDTTRGGGLCNKQVRSGTGGGGYNH